MKNLLFFISLLFLSACTVTPSKEPRTYSVFLDKSFVKNLDFKGRELIPVRIKNDWYYVHSSGKAISVMLDEEGRKKQLKKYVDTITTNATINYQNTIKYFDSPMTFTIKDAKQKDGLFKTTWTTSYSVAGNAITYDLAISKSDDFKTADIIKTVTGLTIASYSEQLNLTAGTYYLRVIARDTTDPTNKWQLPNNLIRVRDGQTYNVLGVKKVLIP